MSIVNTDVYEYMGYVDIKNGFTLIYSILSLRVPRKS